MRRKLDLPWPVSAVLFVVMLVLGFGLLNAFSSPPPHSAPRDQWKTITHKLYGFSIDYPPGWLAETYGEYGIKGDRETKLSISRGFAGSIYIDILYRSAVKPKLDDVVRWGGAHKTLRSLTTEVVSFQIMELNGYEVAKRTYRSRNMYQDVYIAREKDMIIIKLQAEEDDFWTFLPTFEEIVASFRPMY